MVLKEGELHIWRYTLDIKEYYLEKTHPVLSQEEQDRCNAYIYEKEKIRYTCNHRFVRSVLGKYLNKLSADIKVSYAPMGKPFIKHSDLSFNYSYRSDFGLLALTKGSEVGVDIEKIRILEDIGAFTAFSFSEKENEVIFKSNSRKIQDTLFTFWTFKEAIIKTLGVGLNADLTKIDTSPFFYSETNSLGFDNNAVYTLKQIDAPSGYKAAIAIKGGLKEYSEFNFDTINANKFGLNN